MARRLVGCAAQCEGKRGSRAGVPPVDVRAEWPGVVREIHVGLDDAVLADDELITIESMKMLTPVLAPAAGRVAELLVRLDDYVEEGTTLLRLG